METEPRFIMSSDRLEKPGLNMRPLVNKGEGHNHCATVFFHRQGFWLIICLEQLIEGCYKRTKTHDIFDIYIFCFLPFSIIHVACTYIHLVWKYPYNMSCIVRKPEFCLCKNKGADQLREVDQPLCFRYTDSTIVLLLRTESSSF